MSNENENDNPTADIVDQESPVDEGTEEEFADTAVIDELGTSLEAITVERDQLAAEHEELQALLLRRQADFANFRRRTERERAEFAQYAGMETIRALLPVIDDLERALKAVPAELGEDHDYVKGIQMISQRLMTTLETLGLEPIGSVGQRFDPNVHHAVERVPTDEVEDQTILEEWQKGYNFKGKLLREAMVRVAVSTETAED